jgi:NAD(P)-dependent dehydrogenase (short-subunit alcohol dehydrogenase family)
MSAEPGLARSSLAGHVALVAGATQGLGLEIAGGMPAAGAVVDTERDTLPEVPAEIQRAEVGPAPPRACEGRERARWVDPGGEGPAPAAGVVPLTRLDVVSDTRIGQPQYWQDTLDRQEAS